MRIGVIGQALPRVHQRAFEAAGIRIANAGSRGSSSAERAELRLYVGPKPPARTPKSPWLWVSTRPIDPAHAASVVLAGAYDVALLDSELASTVVRRLAELQGRIELTSQPIGFVGKSAAVRRVLADLDRAAQTSMAVLLTGETGTGKDLAARHLHASSGRKGELVPINCAAVPNELIEGELFGYVRGAFSGAVQNYDGQFTAASGGTVFLDEVDDTPKTLQIKLLRVLEDHVVSRLGENVWRKVNFRLVAATNRDLRDLVRRGEFGADLYQRLAIIQIEMPPLRDRLDDLPELAAHLIARFYREEPSSPHRVVRINASALAVLSRYPWPGNVRELRNVLFHALVRKRSGDELLLSDLPSHVVRGRPADEPAAHATPLDRDALARMIDSGRMNLRELREDLERTALELALAKANGSPARAAKLLGEVGRGSSTDPGGTVRAMMRRYGM
jgi:transcriptional regulator with GAF, ATPase, and Fis domain